MKFNLIKRVLKGSKHKLFLPLMVLAFCLFISAQAYAQCAPPTLGLAGHWTLNETSGTFADSSPNSNTGTELGGITYAATGQIGLAADFDATDDLIDVGSDGSLDNVFSGGGSISAWINADGLGEGGNGRIFDKSLNASTNDGWVFYTRNSSGGLAFLYGNTANTDWAQWTAGTINTGTWYHVVLTYDTTDWINNDPVIYIDGVAQSVTEVRAPPAAGPADDSSNNLIIGNTNNQARTFDGLIDDARVYNRALSASEVQALYTQRSNDNADAGTVVFDVSHSLMKYCDGTDWRMMGTGSYNPDGAHFDGSSDDLQASSGLSGVQDGYSGTISYWFKLDSTSTGSDQIVIDSGCGEFAAKYVDSNSQLLVQADSASNSSVTDLWIRTASFVPDTTNWHHFMASWDIQNDANKYDVYIDGVLDEVAGAAHGPAGSLLDYGSPASAPCSVNPLPYSVGADTIGGQEFNGSLADLWMDFNTYIDLSIKENREKFVSQSGMPMYLGEDGSIPTGSSPDIFLSGDIVSWHTNKGTAGGFTENGEITYTSKRPADDVISAAAAPGDIKTGLYHHWALNETSGSNIVDELGIEDISWIDGSGNDVTEESITAVISTGLDLDGSDDRAEQVTITGGTGMNWLEGVSICGWFNPDTNGNNDVLFGLAHPSGPPFIHVLLDNNSQNLEAEIATMNNSDGYPGNPTNYVTTNFTAVSPTQSLGYWNGAWHHACAVYDKTLAAGRLKLYINGVQEAQHDVTDTYWGFHNFSTFYHVFLGRNAFGGNYFDGKLDDIRFYNKALSASEVKILYGTQSCSDPVALTGVIQYSEAFNNMQYCNGVEWVAMGPTGGSPVTSGLIGHWTLDETSGTTAVNAANPGTHDGTWSGSAAVNSTTGIIDDAYDFDGVDDQVAIPDAAALSITDTLTVSAWVNIQQDLTSFTGYFGIADKQDQFGGNSYALYFSSSAQEFRLGTQGAFIESTGTSVTRDNWYHVLGTYDDAADTIKIYVNGELSAEDTSYTDTMADTNDELRFNPDSSNFDRAAAIIDDVRIYNRVLSAQEAAQLYNFGVSGGVGDVSGNCSSPSRPEGIMIYNNDNNLLQYCNGEEWIKIGH